MAETLLNDLNFGHPGAATYNLENREWSFARQYTTRQLRQTRIWKGEHPAATLAVPTSVQFRTPQTSANGTNVQKDARRLVRNHPQLAPASGLLSELALVSAAVLSTASTYDPLIGSLLSFGSITFEDKHEDPRRIAALPAGEGGNILRLAVLTKERHGWAADKGVWVEGPSLRYAECGYWNEVAAPIQQVCFAHSEDRSSLLAVRLPTRTVLFRPVYHRRHQAARPSPFYDLPPSTIDAHPILTVGIDQTGGAPHADVTFNPDFQLQFGIVDQNHTWSVWDIEHGRKSDAYSVSSLIQGPIDPSEDAIVAGEDGWARILWIGDVNTLLVCNRRQLSVIGIKGGSFAYLSCPPLFTERSTDWILDVKPHPRYRTRFFVLTSTRLVLMTVITSSEVLDATADEAGATVLVSWRHYRGADDFTLQCSVHLLSDDESCVLLYSRLNHLVQIYSFSEQSSGPSTLVSSADPTALDLALDGPEYLVQIHLESMQYGDMGEGLEPGPGRSYKEEGFKFYRMMVTRSDLSVHELVIYVRERVTDVSTSSNFFVEDFKRSLVRHPRRNFYKKEVIDEDDDFVVLDGLEGVEEPTSKSALQAPKWSYVQDRTSSHSGMDYRLLYDALVRTDTGEERSSRSVHITVVTDQLEQMLVDDSAHVSLPLGTLLEFAGMNVDVSDVDEASLKLQQLYISEDRHDIAKVQRIASAHVLALTKDEEPTITELYDTILQNWIAPLPADVPIRVRQHKERLARRIAAEIMLGSTRLRQPELSEVAAESQRGPSKDSGVSLPILPSKRRGGTPDSTAQWPFSQPLPAPPFSSVPSSSMPPSSPPLSSFALPTPSDPITRLGKHLQMRESTMSPTIIPQNVNQVLAHWQPGTDPQTYDWDAIERALRPENHEEVSQQQREKARKKKERREKRQQREDELMRAKSSSQPVVFIRSSPGPALGGMGSSGQIPSQAYTQVPLPGSGFRGPGGINILAPQSQIEPGRFGGKPDNKKKKKGRVSGF